MRKPLIIVKKVTEPAGDETTSFPFASNLPQTAAGDGGQPVAHDGGFSLKDGEQVRPWRTRASTRSPRPTATSSATG